MENINTLSDLRNKYPNERSIEQNYENKGSTIEYKGRYTDNSLIFTVDDISELVTVANTSFQLIIKIDDVEYTSPAFKNILQQSTNSGNPYIQKSSITCLSFSQEELVNAENFIVREKYAEVNTTRNLQTIEEIIIHIDWLVSKRQDIREISEYGDWDRFTTEYTVDMEPIESEVPGALGFPYSDLVQSS